MSRPSRPLRVLLLLLAILPAVASLPPAGRAAVYNPETFTLANGLQVVVVTNRAAPVVSQMLWYKAGAADEPRGVSGIAHFLEHLMFRGTAAVPSGEYSRIVARNGGRENAFTAWDYTAYFQSVAVDRLPLVMELEADRMVNLQLDPETIRTERDVILEERRQRIDNSPAARLSEEMDSALFRNQPYHTPIIGWEHEMARLTAEDARTFYRTWYAPNNAVLVVSGDIDAATLRPLAERIYGAIPARPVPERVRPSEPAFGAERRVILHHPEVQSPSLERIYLAPSYHDGPPGDADALQVLDEILGSGNTSRLYRALVMEQHLAVGVGTSYSPNSLDKTTFSLSIEPLPGVPLETVEAAADAEIERLIREGVPQAELEAARQRLLIQADYARDSLRGPAYAFGMALSTGGSVQQVEDWPERIAAVTAAQVVDVARRVLDKTQSVTGLLLPAPAAMVVTQ